MIRDIFSLEGKTAIVTGAGNGMGKAIAIGFAEFGARVAAADINADAARETASEIERRGGNALAVKADVCSAAEVEDLVRRTVERFGTVDILVNVAGGGGGKEKYSSIFDLSESRWDADFRLNATSAFLCSKAAAMVMAEKKRGSIINFSSISGFSNRPDLLAYGSAKGALRLFTDGLAKDLARFGIRVNGIAPANFHTPRPDKTTDMEKRSETVRMVPLARLAEPQEVVGLAVFLASDASSYVTGQTILISGGLDTLLTPRPA